MSASNKPTNRIGGSSEVIAWPAHGYARVWTAAMTEINTPHQIVRQLTEQLRQLENKQIGARASVVSTGVDALDGLLPERGYRRGELVEWIGDGPGSGAGCLALHGTHQACRDGGALVLIDRSGLFYPPVLPMFGIELRQVIVVRPTNTREELWALDQALRCQGVAAVLGCPDQLEERGFRRLQLSAEAGEGLGILLRPRSALQQPTWARTRWQVEPVPMATPPATLRPPSCRRVRVTLAKCRGSLTKQTLELEMEDATGCVRLVPPLAVAAFGKRQTGA